MSQFSQGLADLLSVSGDERQDAALMTASMAAAALTATAEGDVSFAERATLDQAIDALAARSGAPPHLAVADFEAFVDGIRANSSQGRWPAFAALAALAAFDGAADAARTVLRVAKAMAVADGKPSDAERAVVREIAAALAAGPENEAEFG